MELENTVSLTDLLAVMIRKWKGTGISMLVFALLLGGYQGYKQYGLANDPENSPEKIEERYQTALENYETQKEDLQKTLENQEKSLASKEEYLEKSILIKIDPYKKYVTNIVFSFSNIDDSAQLFRYPNTAADYLPKKIRVQYIELWKSMDVPKDIGLAKYKDLEWKYLSELVSLTTLDGDLLSIQAVGATESDAEELANAVYNYFDTHRDVIAASSAAHNFALLNRTTKNLIDEDLDTKQENLKKEIEDLKTTIENSKQAVEDLAEPTKEEGYSVVTIVKAVAKYVILGAAAGMFLACLAVCCWWLFTNRISSSFQLELAAGTPFLGSLSIPRSLSERLAVKVMGERSWRDPEQAASYISRQAKACFPEEGTVLLLSTIPEGKAGVQMAELVKVLTKAGCRVSAVTDALHDPQAVEAIQGCAAVVMAEVAGSSRIQAIRDTAAQVKLAKKPMLGVVLI